MGEEAGSREGYQSFRVLADFDVYDEPTARGLTTVLEHLKLLIAVAGDTATHDQIAALLPVPRSALGAHDPDLDHLTQVLLDECCCILRSLTELAAASQDPNRQQQILATMLTTEPSPDGANM